MSRFASHEPEAFARLQLEQSLDLELSLGGSGERNSHVNDGLPLRLFAIEGRLDEHEARTAQNAVDQKEILEPICVYRRNPAPFHSNLLPALFRALPAPGKNCTLELASSSKFDSAPHYYGWLFQGGTGFATVAGVA